MKKTRVFWQGFMLAVLTILSSANVSLAKAFSKSTSRKGVKVASYSTKKNKAKYAAAGRKKSAKLVLSKKAFKRKPAVRYEAAPIILRDAPRNRQAAMADINPDSASLAFLRSTVHGSANEVAAPEIREDTALPNAQKQSLRNRLVSYSMTLLGRPYVWASSGPRGFDCSGFTHYVFGKMGFELPRGSAEMPTAGDPIPRKQVQKGDILVFTGTNPSIRQPGHVGIAINEPGKPIRFIHSSSNGGVKISDLKGTMYAKRFLMARRVL